MLYPKQMRQITVKEDDPAKFDAGVNAAFDKAVEAGSSPEIHYVDSMGLCAIIRYAITVPVAETLQERYELSGLAARCRECEHYRPSTDKRVKYTRCANGHRVGGATPACMEYYQQLEAERRERDECIAISKPSSNAAR